MHIGITEIVVIFIVALVVLGPEKMPKYAKKVGKAMGELKKYSSSLANEIREEIVEPLNETTAPLKEAMEPITSIKKDLEAPIKEVQKSINSIGKVTPKKEVEKVEVASAMKEEATSVKEETVLAVEETKTEEAA